VDQPTGVGAVGCSRSGVARGQRALLSKYLLTYLLTHSSQATFLPEVREFFCVSSVLPEVRECIKDTRPKNQNLSEHVYANKRGCALIDSRVLTVRQSLAACLLACLWNLSLACFHRRGRKEALNMGLIPLST
jgi:hypothetical protein